MTAAMVEPQQRLSYTPEELRALLERLYGPGTDWELAARAASANPGVNVDQGAVYRWLQGKYRIKGTAAGAVYLLSILQGVEHQ